MACEITRWSCKIRGVKEKNMTTDKARAQGVLHVTNGEPDIIVRKF